ncbi:MAG: LysR family transcriptional regulator [Pseudolabrys sp.]|nr:LysR family transcriptional regulator [Pseudolabrys sp.]
MDFKQLQYFIGLFEQGNMTRAARRLNVVQPALSAQILKLEREFRTKLFERTNRGVTPTASGKRLYELCVPLLGNMNALRQHMLAFCGEVAGDVTVGLIPSVTDTTLAEVVREYGSAYPNVALRVVEGYSGLLIDGVQTGTLDFAVVNNPGKSSSLKLQPLMSEELVLVFAPSYRLCNMRRLQLSQLSRLNFVLPARRHGMRVLIDRYLESKSVILTPKLELDSLVPTLQLVRTGEWVTVLPISAVHRDIKEGALRARRFPPPGMRRELVIVHLPRQPVSLAAQKFIDILENKLKQVTRSFPKGRDPHLIADISAPAARG